MTTWRAAAVAALAGMLLLVSGCSLMPDGGENEALDLTWHVEAFGPGDPPVLADPGRTPVLTLDAGAASGTGGVNTFSGSYTWKRDGTFQFGELAATEMAGPPEAMAQETAFLAALRDTRRYELANAKLLLSDAEGRVLLVFRPQE